MKTIPTTLDLDEIGEAERFANEERIMDANDTRAEIHDRGWTLRQDEREAFNEQNDDLRKT